MRLAYSAQAASAHAGSLASSATTCRRATFRGFFLRCGLLHRGLHLHRRLLGLELDRLAAPHLLQVQDAPPRRTHDVHPPVAEVDQPPFAAGLALDAVDA